MTRQQVIQLVVVLIFFGFSALKVVLGKLQQQAALRRLEAERESQRLEALRTGKSVDDLPGPPRLRRTGPTAEQMQELARRRAAQLEELRRVQAAQRGQVATRVSGSQSGPISSIPGSSGPIVPGARRPGGQTSSQRPTRAERVQAVREPKRSATPQPKFTAPAPQPSARVQSQVNTKPEHVRTIARVPNITPLSRMSPAELRRAFIVTEIFGRPVSQRDQP